MSKSEIWETSEEEEEPGFKLRSCCYGRSILMRSDTPLFKALFYTWKQHLPTVWSLDKGLYFELQHETSTHTERLGTYSLPFGYDAIQFFTSTLGRAPSQHKINNCEETLVYLQFGSITPSNTSLPDCDTTKAFKRHQVTPFIKIVKYSVGF
ncbi:hypothetical protein MBANPS3_012572 [Mucor bainieri]